MAYIYTEPASQHIEGVTTVRALTEADAPNEVVALDIDRGDPDDFYEIVLTKDDVIAINDAAYNRKG